MWQALIGFLGGPVVKGLLDAYNAHLQAGVSDTKIAADLAAQETAAAAQLKTAEIGHPFEPDKLAMYVVLFYVAKVMVWDAALHLGKTDPVNGAVGVWAGLIISYYFGKQTIQNVTKIFKL